MRSIRTLIVALVVLGCRGDLTAPVPEVPLSSSDAEVYAVVIDAKLLRSGRERSMLLLSPLTSAVHAGLNPATRKYIQKDGGFSDAALDDMAAQAGDRRSLAPLLLELNVRLAPRRLVLYDTVVTVQISQAQKKAAATGVPYVEDYWYAHYTVFPTSMGTLSLSRVGYDATHTWAVVAYDHGCAGLCGSGWFVSLRREGMRWVIVKSVMVWVS